MTARIEAIARGTSIVLPRAKTAVATITAMIGRAARPASKSSSLSTWNEVSCEVASFITSQTRSGFFAQRTVIARDHERQQNQRRWKPGSNNFQLFLFSVSAGERMMAYTPSAQTIVTTPAMAKHCHHSIQR